jgi:hypothetical protein
MPQSTDLVTDLPADFETFGQAVATSMADLLGGTTGQILSKASNTDMDFTWTSANPGDITGVTAGTGISGGGTSGDVTITNSMATAIDAKGDLVAGTAADTFSRLAVGTNGQVLTADSSAGTGLAWATPSTSAINLLLNSNFALNQRAYVSAANLASGTYGFDRWNSNYTNTTLTFTASTQGQSITINASGGLQQVIEQGLIPAGTYTLSWTGTATGRVYNSGGTPPSYAASPVTFTADGTANVVVEFTASGTTKTLSKVQFNAGTGTTWTLATPTLQTELAACQRYYQRFTDSGTASLFCTGIANSTTTMVFVMNLPVSMRIKPTTVDYSALQVSDSASNYVITALSSTIGNTTQQYVSATVASGLTQFRPGYLQQNTLSGYLGFGAEL